MAMIASASRAYAERKLDRILPTDYYLTRQALPNRYRLHDLLIVESDDEYWFNTDTAAKQVKLDGLTEKQINVKLCTGHTHCPKCNHDLAPDLPPIAGRPYNIGFYDFDVDPVRIQKQFACKKCRHQWGPVASGPKDASLVAVAAGPRDPATMRTPNAPRAKTAGGPSVRDQIHAVLTPLLVEIGLTDWVVFRKVAIERCTAAGINLGSTTTELPRWRKVQET